MHPEHICLRVRDDVPLVDLREHMGGIIFNAVHSRENLTKHPRIMFCASPQAEYTIVDGRVVVCEGLLATVELGPLIERHNRMARQLAASRQALSLIGSQS